MTAAEILSSLLLFGNSKTVIVRRQHIALERTCATDERPEENASCISLKAVYNLPTTKVLIENLKTNPNYGDLAERNIKAKFHQKRPFLPSIPYVRRKYLSIHAAVSLKNYTDNFLNTQAWIRQRLLLISIGIFALKYAGKQRSKKRVQKKAEQKKQTTADAGIAEIETRRQELKEIGSLLNTLQICCEVAIEVVNVTAKGKRRTGTTTDSIYRLGTAAYTSAILHSALLHDSPAPTP